MGIGGWGLGVGTKRTKRIDHDGHRRQRRAIIYCDLVVWQRAMSLAEQVYAVTKNFPKEEIYGLTSQMRRASVSIASNIAEGHGRQSRGEFLQSLGHARGSLAELHTQVTLASRLKLISQDDQQRLDELIASVGRPLNGLRKSLKSSAKNVNP